MTRPKTSNRARRRPARPSQAADVAFPAALVDAIATAHTQARSPSEAMGETRRLLAKAGRDPAEADAAIDAAQRRLLERLEVNSRLEWAIRRRRNDEQYAMAIENGDLREARQIAKDHGAIMREWTALAAGDDPARNQEADEAAAALRSAGIGHDGDCLADLIREALALLIQHDALPKEAGDERRTEERHEVFHAPATEAAGV